MWRRSRLVFFTDRARGRSGCQPAAPLGRDRTLCRGTFRRIHVWLPYESRHGVDVAHAFGIGAGADDGSDGHGSAAGLVGVCKRSCLGNGRDDSTARCVCVRTPGGVVDGSTRDA